MKRIELEEKKVELRSAIEVMCDVEDAVLKVNELPDVIQLLIENLHLDEKEITPDQQLYIIRRKDMIYNVLTLTQRQLWDMIELIDGISVRKKEAPEVNA